MAEITQVAVADREDSPLRAGAAEQHAVPPAVLELRNLHHELINAATGYKYTVRVDELYLPWGEFVAILGPSGCGKTTLLTILGLARRPFRTGDQPAAERFLIRKSCEAEPLDVLSLYSRRGGSGTIQALRRELLGFCLQSGELLSNLTLRENVEMPMRLNRWPGQQIAQRTRDVLDRLSDIHPGDAEHEPDAKDDRPKTLWDLRDILPSRISGGEYQRVALARAIAHRPRVLFLDEPTGSLDPVTARSALSLLSRMQKYEDVTVVMITHDPGLAKEFAGYMVCMCAKSLNGSKSTPTGTIEKFLRRTDDGRWIETDARWRPLTTPRPESSPDRGGEADAVLLGT